MKAKHPVPSFSLYGGETQIIYECPGDCKLARYYCEPPDPEDPCAMMGEGQSCKCVPARRAAAEALLKVVEAEIKELKEGNEG